MIEQPAVPASLSTLHSADLPCPGCTFNMANELVDDLDFCGGHDGCGHFHIEIECPAVRVA